jgi:hypothetical protein
VLEWRCGVEEHGVDFVEGCEVISWDIQAHWLGEWKDRAAPIYKAFSVLFPFLIVGLLNATAVQGSGAAFILVSYFASKSLKLTPRAKLTPS